MLGNASNGFGVSSAWHKESFDNWILRRNYVI